MEWLGAGPRQTATVRVELALTEHDQQDIRWYIEEYPEYPFAPYPERALRIEERMRVLGHELFNGLFAANPQTLRLWGKIAEHLDDIRVEIVTDVESATALPWELLRDPDTDSVLALHAKSFVRAAPEAPRQALALEPQHVIRILLVICRPGGSSDVPFRSVASRLIKGLSNAARDTFQLDVLRPPTFARLAQVLREAKARGAPYHVVHFDGHGVYGQRSLLLKVIHLSPTKFETDGPQGFLIFEGSSSEERLIHGSKLGDLLVECNVPLLVLNACRSAHSEPSASDDSTDDSATTQSDSDNPYEKVRAFGSLAQQVMLQGVGGVVAMRYNVYVVTAAQFVVELYRTLVQGRPLGEAAARGRKHLHDQPVREIVQTLTLQDWLVPVVYEAQAMPLFTLPVAPVALTFTLSPANTTPKRGDLDEAMPPEPDAGFFGRDETLLAIDRSFDNQQVVLLHAFAGSGKTTAAVEFVRWYSLTGGVDGPVLWSSFEQHLSLTQLLDQLGLLFNTILQQRKIDWQALTDVAQKRDLALQILAQVPVLWVWDNVEPVTGFPAGMPSVWSAAEQRALADFLRAARGTRAKFLLTSRRDERAWLGDLPARVVLPPMPLHERRQLAEALAAKYTTTLDQAAWRPLLVYSGGNPLTLTVVVRQALRDGLRSATQIAAYVAQLRAGEAVFHDEQSEGRSRSLGASLSYGFNNFFTEQERKVLALLHHFQSFVDVDALRLMGETSNEWHVLAVADLTRDQGIMLLDRATEVGLLETYGKGYYRIHPALPWFFRTMYDTYYPDDAPARAYVEALEFLSSYYDHQYNQGNRNVIAMLKAEEANLLYALRLAQQRGWYESITGAMQGLSNLYDHTGRRVEWRQLVHAVEPLFVDPATGGPLPGREEEDWYLMVNHRIRLLKEDRHWEAAAQLHRFVVAYDREQAAPLITLPTEQLTAIQRNAIRSLAASLHQLAAIQHEQGLAACVESYRESYDLTLHVGDFPGAANCAAGLANVYRGDGIPALRDLAQAEEWCQRDLAFTPRHDRLGRGKSLGHLGLVEYERFKEARQAGHSVEVLLQHLNNALSLFQQKLELTPPDAVNSLAITHDTLGTIYGELLPDYLELSIAHYRESIRYEDMQNNTYGASEARENVAIVYAKVSYFDDALLFVRSALHGFQQLGVVAADRVKRAEQFIAEIEQLLRGG